MLAKEKRLNLKKVFKWVASGRKIENGLVKIFFRFGENIEPKVGIAPSKAVFKRAVLRNRARRLVSKGFESLYDQLPQGINIVVMPKEGVLKLKAEELLEVLKKELGKLGK